MLPQPQLMPLIFEGLDTFTDPKRGVATKLDLVENCYILTPFKLQKRQGFTSQTRSINGGGSLAAGTKLTGYRDEELMADGLKLYTKGAVANNWIARGKLPTGSIYSEKITGDTASAVRLNVAEQTAGGLTLTAWQGRSGTVVTWQITENATGALLNSGTFNGITPRIVACAGFLFLASFDTTTNRLEVRKVSSASPSTLGAPTTVDTQASFVCFDMAADTATPQLLFTWWYSADPANVHLRTMNPTTLALGTNFARAHGIAGPPTLRQLCWLLHDYSDGNAYLVVSTTTPRQDTFDVPIASMTLTNQAASVTSSSGSVTGYFASGTKTLIGEDVGGTPDLTIIRGYYSSGPVAWVFMRGVQLAGRIFKQGARYYLPVVYEDTLQRSRFLLEYEHATNGANGGTAVVGFLGSNDDGGVGAGLPVATGYQILSDPTNYGASSWGLSSHYSFDLGAHFGVQRHRVTFTEANVSPPADFADVKMFPGLQLTAYDGASAVESGFYLTPQAPTVAPNAAAGGKNGTYQVKLVYSWTDARGRIWRSAPGPASSVATGVNQKIDVTVKTLRITGKDPKYNLLGTVPPVSIEVYCTVNNGSTFYRETAVTNDVTVDSIFFNALLGMTDAALQAQELLYTTGGVIQNDPLPRPRLLRAFSGRLFACVDKGDVWHTKDQAEGEGAAWSSRFRIPLDTSAGQVTALMDMDQQFLMGQRNAVFVLGGGDPTDTGANLFASPTRINTDVGPVDQVSVARLPNGIAYNSPRGIYQMSRGLDNQFIGQQVQAYTKVDTITGAVVMDGVNQARWITSNGDMLVFDHVIGQWFVWTGLAAVATCLIGNAHAILASDGTVRVEAAGVFSDDANPIVMKIRTGWLSLAGIAGYQRLWDVLVIGEYKGAHTLQMSFAYNFSTFNNETLSVNAGIFTYNTGIEAGYMWEAQPKQQLCTAVQITVQDVLTGAGSEGFQLSGMAINVGVLGGGARVGSSQGLA